MIGPGDGGSDGDAVWADGPGLGLVEVSADGPGLELVKANGDDGDEVDGLAQAARRLRQSNGARIDRLISGPVALAIQLGRGRLASAAAHHEQPAID